MNILILAGGTGSIALQTGLHDALRDIDGVNIKVMVNAYDNGLSTGAVRQVMGGQILGPSDVRKNQTTLLKLLNPSSPWLKLLDIRFTSESSQAYTFCMDRLKDFLRAWPVKEGEDTKWFDEVADAIDEYFKSPLAVKIDYSDFSLANIIYAGLAKVNDHSLRRAAQRMAKILGIPDNVILNDDTSLFLGAITKSGKHVTDEGDIVSWGDVNDPFETLFFTRPDGSPAYPVLCEEAIEAIGNADLIILSSGTQWSSLIPTYESIGFFQAVSQSRAKVVMVMNRIPDKDSPGQSSIDIINALVSKYFDKGRLRVVFDQNSPDQMKAILPKMVATGGLLDNAIWRELSDKEPTRSVHLPGPLAKAVLDAYFGDYLDSDYYMFDYDDTLVGRGHTLPQSSASNVYYLASVAHISAICTGNSIRALALRQHPDAPHHNCPWPELTVFADGGVNKYRYDITPTTEEKPVSALFTQCVDDSALLPNPPRLMELLDRAGVPASKVENRHGAIIAIKPLDPEYRRMVAKLVEFLVQDKGLKVVPTGRTTVEIRSAQLSKLSALKHVLSTNHPKDNNKKFWVTYVGDELQSGNDNDIYEFAERGGNVRCLEVKNPAQTAVFLRALYAKTQQWTTLTGGKYR